MFRHKFRRMWCSSRFSHTVCFLSQTVRRQVITKLLYLCNQGDTFTKVIKQQVTVLEQALTFGTYLLLDRTRLHAVN